MNRVAGSSVRIDHHPPNMINHGNLLFDHTIPLDHNIAHYNLDINWNLFSKWLDSKYAKSYSTLIYCYARKYYEYINNVKMIDLVK